MSYRRKPITVKKEAYFTSKNSIKSNSCTMQGWRKNMEDSYSMTELASGILMYGVYDGHGGNEVSVFIAKYLPEIFKDLQPGFDENEIKEGFKLVDQLLLDNTGMEMLNHKNLRDSIFKAQMLEYRRDYPDMSIEEITKQLICERVGSTASIVFIDGDRIVSATLGDCQAVIAYKNGESYELQDYVHQLHSEIEESRVIEAGLDVLGTPPRICGDLAVSRSFGDFRYKNQGTPKLPEDKQPVSIIPDIKVHYKNEDADFLLIASDGIFDVLSHEDIVAKIQNYTKTKTTKLALENLLDDCLCPLDEPNQKLGKDNMCTVFVQLNN